MKATGSFGYCQDCRHATLVRTEQHEGSDVPLYSCRKVIDKDVYAPQWDRVNIQVDSGGYEVLVGHLFGCVNFQPREAHS